MTASDDTSRPRRASRPRADPPSWRRRAGTLATALLVAAGTGAATARADGTKWLKDQSGTVAVQPSYVQVTNHDYMDGLRWTSWGGPTATGIGVLHRDLCVPDCVRGTFAAVSGVQLLLRGDTVVNGRHFYPEWRTVATTPPPSGVTVTTDWWKTLLP
jgi:hypothetical protein